MITILLLQFFHIVQIHKAILKRKKMVHFSDTEHAILHSRCRGSVKKGRLEYATAVAWA